MTGSDVPPSFRLAYVPGVTPAKWVRTWQERVPEVPLTLIEVSAAEAAEVVRAGDADAGLIRLPTDRTGLSAIPLYTETTVVVVRKDHLVAAAEEVSTADLADDILLRPCDDTLDWQPAPGNAAVERPATTGDAIELVAAGAGLLLVPQSLARLHHRKDLTYRPVTDAPESRIALSWLAEETTDLMEQFIGIVRGRTVNSTRGRPPVLAAPKPKRPDPERKPVAGRSTGRSQRRGSDNGSKRGKPRRRS